MCAICAEDDPDILKEFHHVFGRGNNPIAIPLCLNHHYKITKKAQNKLPRYIKKKTAPKKFKIIFILRSMSVLLEVVAKELQKISEDIREEKI